MWSILLKKSYNNHKINNIENICGGVTFRYFANFVSFFQIENSPARSGPLTIQLNLLAHSFTSLLPFVQERP